MTNNKHNFSTCPKCGANVSEQSAVCWQCQLNLNLIYNQRKTKIEEDKQEEIRKLEELKSFEIINPKKLIKIIGSIIALIIAIHIIAYSVVFSRVAKSGIHTTAKAYMSGAFILTVVDIVPLEKVFGLDNFFVWPFKATREWLYQKGAENIPADDGETYIWWFMIYFPEYVQIIGPEISKLTATIRNENNAGRYNYKVKKYLKKTEILPDILEPLAKLKIKDKDFRDKRLNDYNAILLSYKTDKALLLISTFKITTGKKNGYYNTDEHIKKLKYLYNQYIKLTNSCKNNEKESYDHFFNKTNRHMYHYAILKLISEEILEHMEHKGEKLTCDNEFLISFGKNYGILKKEYYGKPKSLDDSVNMGWILMYYPPVEGRWAQLCPDHPDMRFFNDYIINDIIDTFGQEKFDKLIINSIKNKED